MQPKLWWAVGGIQEKSTNCRNYKKEALQDHKYKFRKYWKCMKINKISVNLLQEEIFGVKRIPKNNKKGAR